jgi:predicted secreted Zn-dependent protease
MQEWKQRDSRPKAEQGEWDRFLRALRAHEDGHIALYRREFSRSFKRLKKVAASKFQDEFNDEVARVKAVNRKYDKMTGNGTKQETPHGTTIIQVP